MTEYSRLRPVSFRSFTILLLFWSGGKMGASIDGRPKQTEKKQLVSVRQHKSTHHPEEKSTFRSPHCLPLIRHVTMLRCNKPVPSVAAAPSPAPLPAFDRFIPAKGAKGRGGRAGILAGGRRRRKGGGGGGGCSEMKASTVDVRGLGWGAAFPLLVCALGF